MNEAVPKHTVNLTPAGSGSTKILLMSYRASELRPGRGALKAVRSHHLKCNSQLERFPRDPGSLGCRRAKSLDTGVVRVSGDGSRGRERTLTFVPPIGFLHMVWKGENLGAVPRDYYGQRESSGAFVKPDPKGHTMKHKTVLWLRASN